MGLFSFLFEGLKLPAPGTERSEYEPVDIIIRNPQVGFLNLQGAAGAELADSDQRAIGPLFQSSTMSVETIPKCDVLFVYCSIDSDGNVVGSSNTLFELFKLAGAKVAVVASPNKSEHYIRAVAQRQAARCNYILVHDRNGDVFTLFFRHLFEKMLRGQSMLTAWVGLAPQGGQQTDVPSTVMVAGAGHVVFGMVAN